MREYNVKISIEKSGLSMESEVAVDACSIEEAKDNAISKVNDNIAFFANDVENIGEEDPSSEYRVSVGIQYGVDSFDVEEIVNAYSEGDAKEEAISTIRDNYIVCVVDVECEEEA